MPKKFGFTVGSISIIISLFLYQLWTLEKLPPFQICFVVAMFIHFFAGVLTFYATIRGILPEKKNIYFPVFLLFSVLGIVFLWLIKDSLGRAAMIWALGIGTTGVFVWAFSTIFPKLSET